MSSAHRQSNDLDNHEDSSISSHQNKDESQITTEYAPCLPVEYESNPHLEEGCERFETLERLNKTHDHHQNVGLDFSSEDHQQSQNEIEGACAERASKSESPMQHEPNEVKEVPKNDNRLDETVLLMEHDPVYEQQLRYVLDMTINEVPSIRDRNSEDLDEEEQDPVDLQID